MTVADLDRRLGPDELAYWRGYLRKRPTTERTSWIQLAFIMRLIISVNTEKGKPIPDLEDLIPLLDL